ncbi:SEC-independent protein translocase TATC [Rufibacter radiotolerans]|uniref:SEC-independent protein translocase TATC n=1 Tax=Rufibacter radiotolerans TaxID=1379910 RepID=A0A0H4VTS2_9BACT|nr:group III truncated hemoglobin [Rufibacter radiotolerans]AKQ47342.1 SEC-independent protein translocase TATC [Rufibacter radiotolerans]
MQENTKPDITTEEDIKTLVDTFYGHVNQDDLLSPVFNEFAQVDWEHHLPKMYQFWSTVLFGSMAYKGQPFPKHFSMPIDRTHFTRWIALFNQTVEELFKGPMADQARQKATSIANIFQMKMGLYSAPLVKP